MKTIGLCMIVKNESHVILRCLESVRPLVDYVLIEDTGSTDGTQQIITEWLVRQGVAGEVIEEPWRDFAHNRSHALRQLRKHQGIDYALMMDADDQLFIESGFDVTVFKDSLSKDLYAVAIRNRELRYQRNQMCRNHREFRYRGVLHEFLEGPPGNVSSGTATGLYISSGREGARSSDPDKYRKDTQVLEKALDSEKDPLLRSRYTFYLARSYHHAGEREKALKNYLKRAELGHWPQEIFVSLYSAAQLMQAMGRPFDEVIRAYLRACEAAPSRAEALHAASRLCRENKKFSDGYEYARRGLRISHPPDSLFVEQWIYDYGLLDELAVNAYWAEQYEDSLQACQRLLREGKMPQDMYDRVRKNADFAVEKIKLQRIFSSETADAKAEPPPPDGRKGEYSAAKVQENSGGFVQIYAKQFRIFRTIQIVWVGDEAKRPDNCIETWRRMNPDWKVQVWGNLELRSEKWRNMAHIKKMMTRELCGVADMMRWEILERHGGFAIDADSVCVRPLADWLFEPEIFASWENEIARPGLIANGYVYSHPGNALIRQVISDIEDLPDVTSSLAWQLTGPQRLTDTIRNMAYTAITVYPSHYFMPEHLTGARYSGNGPIFAKQFWGRARPQVYDALASAQTAEIVITGGAGHAAGQPQ